MSEKKKKRTRRVRPLFDPDGVYTHEQVMQALCVGPDAWRNACKRGLKHAQIARRLLITGRQIAEFIELLGEQNARSSSKPPTNGEAPQDAEAPDSGAGS